MHCLILFRDSAGRLPTAEELRQCGFGVSAAALPAAESPLLHGPVPALMPAIRPELALAAEPAAQYGSDRHQAVRPESPRAVQARPPVAKATAADAGA